MGAAVGCHGAMSRDHILVRWKLRTSCQFAAGTNPLHGPTDVGVRHFVALSTLNIQHTVEFLLPLLLSPGGSDLRDCHCSRVDHHSCRLRALQTESSSIYGDINSSIADKPEIPSFFDLFGEFPEFGSF